MNEEIDSNNNSCFVVVVAVVAVVAVVFVVVAVVAAKLRRPSLTSAPCEGLQRPLLQRTSEKICQRTSVFGVVVVVVVAVVVI